MNAYIYYPYVLYINWWSNWFGIKRSQIYWIYINIYLGNEERKKTKDRSTQKKNCQTLKLGLCSVFDRLATVMHASSLYLYTNLLCKANIPARALARIIFSISHLQLKYVRLLLRQCHNTANANVLQYIVYTLYAWIRPIRRTRFYFVHCTVKGKNPLFLFGQNMNNRQNQFKDECVRYFLYENIYNSHQQ
jgi:hypothetical protein